MAYKLIESTQSRWRAVNGPHLVALVRTGAVFEKGKLIERPTHSPDRKEAAWPRPPTDVLMIDARRCVKHGELGSVWQRPSSPPSSGRATQPSVCHDESGPDRSSDEDL